VEEGKRKPRIRPADEEDDFDFRDYQLEREIEEAEEEEIQQEEDARLEAIEADILEEREADINPQGDQEDAQTKRK